MVDTRYLPFLIIAPILVLALIGGAVYVTCWRTTLVVPPPGWKPYTLRERKSVKDWFTGLRHPKVKVQGGGYDEENYQMLDRAARMGTGGAGGPTREPEDWHSLRSATAGSISSAGGRYEPSSHVRNASYASYHSAYSQDIAADDEISDEEDQQRHSMPPSRQQTQMVDLGPIIADIRLAIDSAMTLLQQFKTLSEFDANAASSPPPGATSPPPTPGSPGSLLTEEDHRLVSQLQSLATFHEHVLTYAWQHSGPAPPPLDTSHLQQLKDVTARGMTVAMQAETRRTQLIRSKEVLRTQWLSRYGDLRRTEEFARTSLSQIIQRRQQNRVGSSVEETGEMENEVRMLGLRAMRERIALGRKLELKNQEEGSEDEWGLEGSDSDVGGPPVIPSPPPPLFAEPRRVATDNIPTREVPSSSSRQQRRATDEGYDRAYVQPPPRIVDSLEEDRLLGKER